jgi:elongation factor G
MVRKVEDIRNVAFCGHGSSGKTSLVDKILTKTGAVSGSPSVDQGTSICDFDPEEKHHKYSIEAALVHCSHGGKHLNIIDTPGYPDFIGQTICSLQGVDNAVIVINAQSGLQVNTRRVFDEAGKAGLGRMLLISKLDGDNIDFPALVESIRAMWGNKCVLVNVPIGVGAGLKGVVSTLHVPSNTAGALVDPQGIHDALIESVIEVDEEIMAKYLMGTLPHRTRSRSCWSERSLRVR